MKKTLFLTVSFLLLYAGIAAKIDASAKVNSAGDQTITVYCSPDLTNIAKEWTRNYCGLNPDLKISLITINTEEINRMVTNEPNLAIISNSYYQTLANKSIWKLTIGREIIVPVINSDNPFIEAINQQGISSSVLAELLIDPEKRNWASLFNNGEYIPFNYYQVQEESIKSKIEEFLALKNTDVKGIEVNSNRDLVNSIQNDPNGVGFCKLTDVINPDNEDLADHIRLLPIDKNGNGQIDYFEEIYNNVTDFCRGVWIGKYPKILINDIYFVSNHTPKNANEVAFIKYILTDGQRQLEPNGFNELVYNERWARMEKLNENVIYSKSSNDYATSRNAIFILLIVFAVGGIISGIIYLIAKKQTKVTENIIANDQKVINESKVTIPKGVYFDKTHTWIFMEKEGIVKIGIDDFLQHVTGNYTRIKMKNPGDLVKKNEQILSLIQNGKQINISAPISGLIKEINEELVIKPSLINTSPYDEGWVYMIEPSNWLREIQFLRMADKYKTWLHDEFARLKDFIISSTNAQSPEPAYIALQEGGEIRDCVLKDLDPKIWEDFQKKFIDNSELR